MKCELLLFSDLESGCNKLPMLSWIFPAFHYMPISMKAFDIIDLSEQLNVRYDIYMLVEDVESW